MASNSFRGSAEREAFWREQVGAWRAEVERAERAGREHVTVRYPYDPTRIDESNAH